MATIHVLSPETIDQIAAGEVVERPLSIVKELVENSIDAGADHITVEIEEGGTTFIRITDNGSGIDSHQVETAFLRHATSKIKDASDLIGVTSLGFRGEALSSIAAVSQVEMITKTRDALTGIRYNIEGGQGGDLQELGAPDGTTIIIRNLFYNIPVRRKFLKSAATEGSYIADVMEHLALSAPNISFKFVNKHQTKFQTSGQGDLKEVIYRIFGKDISDHLIPIDYKSNDIHIHGYLGKPEITRSSRNYETFFVNGRFVKSDLISRALEDAYKPYLMMHKFPFCVLNIEISPDEIDVNVHPSKLEIRFIHREQFYETVKDGVLCAFLNKELTRDGALNAREDVATDLSLRQKLFEKAPEPFEASRLAANNQTDQTNQTNQISQARDFFTEKLRNEDDAEDADDDDVFFEVTDHREASHTNNQSRELFHNSFETSESPPLEQASFHEAFLSEKAKKKHKFIGQYLNTYWLIEYEKNLYIIDQHAAHEKVMYERLISHFKENAAAVMPSQNLLIPLIISLSARAYQTYCEHVDDFAFLGFETEEYGGNEIALRSIPLDLFGCNAKEMFLEVLDELSLGPVNGTPDVIHTKIASMACKAAVKGNMHLSMQEAMALVDELLSLDNPYNCPHGRPTILIFSKQDIERKFKRIIS